MAVALSGLPCVTTFDTVGEPETLSQRWTLWKAEYKLYVAASGISNKAQKRALLLHVGGPGLREIFSNFSAEQRGADDAFDTALALLDEYFKLKLNIPKARQNFLETVPEPGETVNNYIVRLKVLVKHCNYGDESDNQVRDRVLSHIKDQNLKSKMYREENLSLAKMTKIISEYHDKGAMVLVSGKSESKTEGDVKYVKSTKAQYQNKGDRSRGKPQGPKFQGKCWRCDTPGHMGKDCRISKNHVCEKCGYTGHFEIKCKTNANRETPQNHGYGRGRGRGRGNRGGGRGRGTSRSVRPEENESDRDDPGAYYVFSVYETEYLFNTRPNAKFEDVLNFSVNDTNVGLVVDSGAFYDMMSETDYKKLEGKVRLEKCTKKLFSYASKNPLPVLGQCKARITVPETGASRETDFIVIPNAQVSLLSNKTSKELGVLKIGVNAGTPVNACRPSPGDKWPYLQDKYPSVFNGLGKLKDYQLKLHVDETVQPVIQSNRRIPFSRREKVSEKLVELEKLDVIEKVTGPTRWLSPLVAVEKPNGDVRICIDMRQPNQAIIRERHPVPTVEETIQEMSGGKVFSKLDLNMAYHQVELHPDSREITTFAGPDGLYRYKRLLFGVNMATEKFQQIISQVIKDCPGAYNMSDDIIIVGATQEEHDIRLEKVVQKLNEHGLTLNATKCQINVPELTYMGHVLTSRGLQVSDEKVKAIVNAPPPKDRSEVRSFLGLAQFCAKFIPNFASITSPLWDLTGDVEWKWTESEENAFREVKSCLTRAPVMAYFTPGLPTRIVTDASPVGLGAILEQKQSDGEYRPVYYASRKLTDTESRYSQFEREALGVYWACKRFYLYLIGIEFEILTDHKPLVSVLGAKSKPPSARIERWLLQLQQYSYTITHIPGKANRADILSRTPVPDDATTRYVTEDCVRTDDYVYSVALGAIPAALVPSDVEKASAEDETLQIVRECIESGDWKRLTGTIYMAVKDELWIIGQIVMRGNRIILPEKLWEHTVKLAHEGHQGIVRTKSRLREKVWWPNIDKQVESFIKACYPCQLVARQPRPEPMISTQLPEGPWVDIAIDLLEIPGGNHLLVVIDYFSRWPEVISVPKTDAHNIIKSMESIFQTHGLPESVRSDNGQPFASAEFGKFLSDLGIVHHKGVPYWPQSNGEVERFNGTVLKIIRIAGIEKKNWKSEMCNFLFHYRTTPHSVTGISPGELLMGRKLRDKLPKVTIASEKLSEGERRNLILERDAARKQKQKEYADKHRLAHTSDIHEGDTVLVKQLHKTNKLTPNFEPVPSQVIRKDGNAVIVQSPGGPMRMRNSAHVKKFIPTAVTTGVGDITEAVQPTVSTPTRVEPQEAVPTTASPEVVPVTAPRPGRERNAPAWMKDFVSK